MRVFYHTDTMKIAILGTAWPYRGGIAAFNERLAKEFISEGHQVDLITFTLQYPSFLFPGKTQYTDSPAPEGLHIERMIHSMNPVNWQKTGRLLRERNYDLAVVAYWMPAMAPCLGTICRILRKKTRVVALMHNVMAHDTKKSVQQLTRFFVGSIDKAVVMVAAEKRNLKHFRKDLLCVVSPHPIYDSYGNPMTKAEAAERLHLAPDFTYLLFFGLIRDYKGLDRLLKAYAKVGNPNVRLLIAGEYYSNRAQYDALISDLRLEDKVICHTHYIPDEEVAAYFSIADLVVQPYKSATQSGITQIAYHFSKPMLVTRVGGLPEMVPNGKAGYVVEPNVASIAMGLVDFCNNPDPNRFAQGIAEQKKKYAWSTMTRAILS